MSGHPFPRSNRHDIYRDVYDEDSEDDRVGGLSLFVRSKYGWVADMEAVIWGTRPYMTP